MLFSRVIMMTLCTVVVTTVGSDDISARYQRLKRVDDDVEDRFVPCDIAGAIDTEGFKWDVLNLVYVGCDGPDYFDSWIVGGCDKCRLSL